MVLCMILFSWVRWIVDGGEWRVGMECHAGAFLFLMRRMG